MITSGQLFDSINEKIAILKNEINQAGKLGILNIHKQCENLVKNMLNMSYDYALINLNDPVTNFPGIDVGDSEKGIAYQVTSEKTSGKVDETLEKVVRFKHYVKFPSIKIFMLSPKQGSYTLNTDLKGLLQFDSDSDIVDFDDWLKSVQHLSVDKLQAIKSFLDTELPYTIRQLKGQETSAQLKLQTLVDSNASLQQSGMTFFQHSVIRVRLLGQSFSTPVLFQKMNKFYEGVKKNNLPLFNDVYRQSQSAQQMDYYEKLNRGNVINYFKEGALRIQANAIIFEKASYTTEQLQLTNLTTEFLAIFSLLVLCKELYGNKQMQVELDLDIASNGKLCFIAQNSYLHVSNYFSSPVLNPSPLSFSKVVHDIENASLNDIFTDMIHGFVTEGQAGYFFQPFLELNENEQNRANTGLKGVFSPSLKDIA
ncbi:MAG: SMEK domain-containing protein [Mucilaginibacter sp.]